MARMARKGLGNPVGLQWGDLGSSCWGRGCCQPARFLPLLGKSPAQRSLSRAGTELVSRLAAPRGTGAGRSQGVRRTAAGLEERREGLMGDGAPDGNSSRSAASAGASQAVRLHFTGTWLLRFLYSLKHTPGPRCPSAWSPSSSGMSSPARRNTWLDSLLPCPPQPFPIPHQHAKAPEGTVGRGGGPTRHGAPGGLSEPAAFHPPPQRAWQPQSHPSCPSGGPWTALCWGLGSEGLTSTPPLL